MPNPLIDFDEINFSKIKPEHIVPAITLKVEQFKTQMDKVLNEVTDYNFDNLVLTWEILENEIQNVYMPVRYLNMAVQNDEFNEQYTIGKKMYEKMQLDYAQNEKLFKALNQVIEKADELLLTDEQKAVIYKRLIKFEVNGLGLDDC